MLYMLSFQFKITMDWISLIFTYDTLQDLRMQDMQVAMGSGELRRAFGTCERLRFNSEILL